jgi:hypothetical protein
MSKIETTEHKFANMVKKHKLAKSEHKIWSCNIKTYSIYLSDIVCFLLIIIKLYTIKKF